MNHMTEHDKKLLLAFIASNAATAGLCLGLAGIVIRAQGKRYQTMYRLALANHSALLKMSHVALANHNAVHTLVEVVDPELAKDVLTEVEFQHIVALGMDKEPGES